MDSLTIRPVLTRADRSEFVSLPERLYREDPLWVPTLRVEDFDRFSPRHPFFENGEAAWFLARRGDRTVGRVCVCRDSRFEQHWGRRAVFFGAFEVENDPDAAIALLDSAASWGRERGATEVLGPAYFSMNEVCGLLIEGFDTPPAIMMPYNPRYYADLIERAGFAKEKDLLSHLWTDDQPLSSTMVKLAERARGRRRIETRAFDRRRFAKDLHLIRDIFNESWVENWGTVPLTVREIDHIGKSLRHIADMELIRLAFVDGEPAAVGIAIPDLNPLIRRMRGRLDPRGIFLFLTQRRKMRGVRVTVGGIRPRFRKIGVDVVLYSEAVMIGRTRGYRSVEMGWTLENNDLINTWISSIGTTHKRFRIYRRAL